MEPDGEATWTYDAGGRLTEASTALGRTTKYRYNPTTGWVSGITAADGTGWSFDRNDLGLVTAVRPAQLLGDTF